MFGLSLFLKTLELGANHMTTYPAIQSSQEVQDRLKKLPEFSQRVYRTAQEYLEQYEANFSDLMVDDLAKLVGVSSQSIDGALVHLRAQGLVHIEEFRANFKTRYFIHTYEHDLD